MKTLLVIISFLLFATSLTETQVGTHEYIKFENMDNNAKDLPPIYISKQALHFVLNHSDSVALKDFQNINPTTTGEILINLRNRLLVTDSTTYANLLSFITGRNQFYLNGFDKFNPTESSLDIIANGKTYSLFYKTQHEFFKELNNYLKEKNCDKRVVATLSQIY